MKNIYFARSIEAQGSVRGLVYSILERQNRIRRLGNLSPEQVKQVAAVVEKIKQANKD